MANLGDKVCLVTGASRGIGRGIALQLAVHGAVCYITGRSFQSLQKVADEAKERGASGKIIPVQCDHSDDEEVMKLFEKIQNEQNDRLDLLVNNAYAAVTFLMENKESFFWDLDPIETWDTVNNVGLRNHYICSVYAARMMVARRKGLIINIGSIGGLTYMATPTYGIGKVAKDRMVKDCSVELNRFNVAYLSLWPSAVRTEFMMEQSQKEDFRKDENYEAMNWIMKAGETTEYSGKCIVNLLLDPHIMKKSGNIYFSTDLADEYKIRDTDGRSPNSLRSFKTMFAGAGQVWLVNYIPSFLKIPMWIYRILLAGFTAKQTKNPGKYQ